MKIVIIRNI